MLLNQVQVPKIINILTRSGLDEKVLQCFVNKMRVKKIKGVS